MKEYANKHMIFSIGVPFGDCMFDYMCKHLPICSPLVVS